jgi:hypothetical protein
MLHLNNKKTEIGGDESKIRTARSASEPQQARHDTGFGAPVEPGSYDFAPSFLPTCTQASTRGRGIECHSLRKLGLTLSTNRSFDSQQFVQETR